VVSESSQTVIVVTASVKYEERGGLGHTFKSLNVSKEIILKEMAAKIA
jgi:hypothetical protein